MKKLLLLTLPVLLFTACQPAPEPINYGEDACDFCKMTIVDAQHGAEAVTAKGKVFKFDAIECLANFTEQNQDKSFAFLLVNDYYKPKELVDAASSYYLISQNLPSPMGAYLTAFGEQSAALEMQQAKGGEVFDWQSVLVYLREKGVVSGR